MKRIYYAEEARKHILEGAEVLYEAVASTLGAKGNNVIIGTSYGQPVVTHDGVTVARSVDLKKGGQKHGMELIRQAALKMNEEVGDGTTTVTVLAYHLMKACHALLASRISGLEIRNILNKLQVDIQKQLEEQKTQPTSQQLVQVAAVSCNDQMLGEMIADLIEKTNNGVITVQMGKQQSAELSRGFEISSGFCSPYFAIDVAKNESVFVNLPIFITSADLESNLQLEGITNLINEQQWRNVLFLAPSITADALQTLVIHRVEKKMGFAGVEAPYTNQKQLDLLEDVAAFTGGKVISDWRSVSLDDIGFAKQVVINSTSTTLVEGAGKPADVAERADSIRTGAKTPKEEQPRKIRAAKLLGQAGVLTVAGVNTVDSNEKRYRADDAVCAVKSAKRSGIVPGGGVALRDVDLKAEQYEDNEQRVANSVQAVLRKPFEILLENAGIDPSAYYKSEPGSGFNVVTNQKINMIDAGIIDPYEVASKSVEYAFGLAILAITAGGLITEDIDE